MRKIVFEYGAQNMPGTPCKVSFGYSAGRAIGYPNWHEHVELLTFSKGEGYVLLDNRKCPYRAGESVIVSAQVIHSLNPLSETDVTVIHFYRWFCVQNGIQTDAILFRENTGQDAELMAAVGDMRRASEKEDAFRAARINCTALRLLLLLCEKYARRDAVPSKSSLAFERTKNVMLMLKQNMEKNHTLEEIAGYAGINKYQFSREFKELTGQSVFGYLNAIRCREAQRLLLEGSSVTQAAFSSGFQNLSYFSRTYKKYLGELPTETQKKFSGKRKSAE